MTGDFAPIDELDGPGEVRSNVAELARLFPDAVVDGMVDLDVLRDLLGGEASSAGTEGFGLRWPGMAASRRLSTVPATKTLLPEPQQSVDWATTKNIVIEGDNLEGLRLLRRGYTNSIDVIYIDPPYNTGNDFVYDDKRVASFSEHEAAAGLRDESGALQAGDGSDRAEERKTGASLHSKWLSMMYPRLLVAHHLLKETGVILVAIDDTEHARLKLLLDRTFGAENFIATIVWQGGRKNDSRYVSVGHDYMLIYAKNESLLQHGETRWREHKTGVHQALKTAREIWDNSGHDPAAASQEFRTWLAHQPDLTPAVTRFKSIDDEGRVYNADRDLSWPGGGGPVYDVIHPVTRKPVTAPSRGWLYSPERFAEQVQMGLVEFGPDERKIPRGKTYLDELDSQVAESVFTQIRTMAGQRLKSLLGSDVFPFPKDVDVLSRWINLVTKGNPDAIVMDFFAGSGSTGHAVLNLNAADSGRRRYILMQLDERVDRDGYETIADITRERLRRVGEQIEDQRDTDSPRIDSGFRSYRVAGSNVKAWDGTGALDLLAAVDNLTEGRTSDDLLVEMMLRLGVDLVTPVDTRDVAGSTLYSLAGTLYAFFGTDVTVGKADKIAAAIVAWRDAEPVDSDVTVVVRDTGFVDSSAKLNFAYALKQAGIKTLRSI